MNEQNRRPKWQEDRGPRWGNLRRQVAELKVRARRTERAQHRAQTLKELE